MNRSIPIFKDYEVNRRPKTSKEFEDLVRKCALVKLGNRFSLFGRNGQNQKGIDIYSEDWGTVIQCKCFDFEKKGSVQRLIEEGKRDYQEAVRAFGDTMKTFVIATTLNTDTKIQENFKDNTSTGEIELWFWEDIKEIIETYQINNANDIYVNSFIKPLFLHKDEKYRGKVCLKNLFILQKYRDIKGDDSSKDVKADLEDRLSRFINVDKDSNILIIEGDAGCGKSSLIGWLNYHANEDDAISKHVLGQRNLITIRLRDLKKETINNNNSLKDAIVEYMNIKFLGGIDYLNDRFPNAVLVLDGFDELCMLDNISNYNDLIAKLNYWLPEGYKIIITSRLNYIDRRISIPRQLITLEHFDKEKIKEWVNCYEGKGEYECGQDIDENVKNYILSENDYETKISSIIDTPLTLYLLVSRRIDIEKIGGNIWRLYRELFYEIIPSADYNKQMKEFEDPRKDIDDKDEIYLLTEEIAYGMYKGENKYYYRSNEMKDIIKEIEKTNDKFQQKNIKENIEQAYALYSYWKADSCDGVVEFYHNNIRDFFLCERIFRKINDVYSKNISDKDKVDELIKIFVNDFKYGYLEDGLCSFIMSRAMFKNKDDFPQKEREIKLLPTLYEEMLTNGELYDNLKMKNHISAIVSILACTAFIYKNIYDSLLDEGEYINWWNDIDAVNNTGVIDYFFKKFMYKISSRGNFENINLKGIHLLSVDFGKANLKGAHLEDANLKELFLGGEHISVSNLSGAHLEGAHLEWAYLEKIILRKAYMYGVVLKGASLREADLRGTDLRSADLEISDLFEVNLENVDLRGAFLEGAILPDGFSSPDVKEQTAHLKSMNIKGLLI